MPVDPLLRPVIDAMNAQLFGSANAGAELEAAMSAAAAPGLGTLADDAPEVASIVDHRVPVPDGEITVRMYTPSGPGPFPVHLFLHGGSFWLGTLDESEARCRHTANSAGCVVAAVGYRLAPKHKFPTAPEDCFAALRWLVDNAPALGVDAARVSVGGVSAGGNLAAVVALMARDRGGPPLVFQVLEIPVTDLTLSFPSITENGEGYVLTKESCVRYVRLYLADPAQATDPYASPYFAGDLSRLPPALVVTAEFDPVRDEGEAYARRLEAAGVAVELVRMNGHIHGSMAFTKLMTSARAHRERVHARLRDAYRR